MKQITPELVNKVTIAKDPSKVLEINLSSSSINAISSLEIYKNLKELDLSCNYIKKLENVDKNKALKALILSFNKIDTIMPITLVSLTSLDICNNEIISIEKLIGLKVR
jgi:Leucine-rich repeat (LRR) protein